MDGNVYQQIEAEYEALRDRKEREAEERKEKLYAALPTLQEIDERVNDAGFAAVRARIHDPEADVSDLEGEIASLGEMKKRILLEAGLPEDYLEPKYECEKCKDTGHLPNGERCDCYRQKLAIHLYDMSNLEYVMEKENFDTFRMDIFSDRVFEDEGISPRENMTFILDVVRKFIEGFPEKNDENLLFYGTTGLGKTFLSNCIAKELLDRGHTVIYQTAFTFLDILERRKFYREERKDTEPAYRLLFDADLLIIDDLGTEVSNRFTVSEIFNIVNTRLLRGKKTIISTNLSPLEMSQVYTDRTFSRIFQKFIPLKFFGKDLRWEI